MAGESGKGGLGSLLRSMQNAVPKDEFRYVASDADGNAVEGTVQAWSDNDAADEVLRLGLVPEKVVSANQGTTSISWPPRVVGTGGYRMLMDAGSEIRFGPSLAYPIVSMVFGLLFGGGIFLLWRVGAGLPLMMRVAGTCFASFFVLVPLCIAMYRKRLMVDGARQEVVDERRFGPFSLRRRQAKVTGVRHELKAKPPGGTTGNRRAAISFSYMALEPVTKLDLADGGEITLNTGRKPDERRHVAQRVAECLKVPLDDRVPEF